MSHIATNFNIGNFVNISKIPNNAVTHYSYYLYPARPIVPQTQSHAMSAPNIHIRKIITQSPDINNPGTTIVTHTPTAQTKAHKPRSKYRNNINKDALAQYFDNSDKTSATTQWLDEVVNELNRKDAEHAAQTKKSQEELHQYVEAIRSPAARFKEMEAAHYAFILVIDLTSFARDIIFIIQEYNNANARPSAREEINANTLYKFEQQMRRANQTRGIRKMTGAHNTHTR